MKWCFVKNKKKRFIMIVSFVILGICALLLFSYFLIPLTRFGSDAKMRFGLTFSVRQASALGLNWREVYIKIFDDFEIDSLRLPVYWDDIEIEPGKFNFDDLDWQMDYARFKGRKVVLAIGYKTPRWPECRKPSWVSNEVKLLHESVLKMLNVVVNRYKYHEALSVWQVENEPYFTFGKCIALPRSYLSEKVAFVKSLDPTHNIMVTDSGELGSWRRISKVGADILGVTTYRKVWNPIVGYFRWWFLTPNMYKKRAYLIDDSIRDIWAVEVQAEPWHNKFVGELSVEEVRLAFSIDDLRESLRFVRGMNFSHSFFWGVEWWYFMAEQYKDASYLNEIKSFIN